MKQRIPNAIYSKRIVVELLRLAPASFYELLDFNPSVR